MLAFSSRKSKGGGGSIVGPMHPTTTGQRGGSNNQPLPYIDPTYSSPNAAAGADLLKKNDLILRPRIGGGSIQQPLAYVDPTYSSPNASAGTNLLKQNDLILRPRIGGTRRNRKHGGFIPSVMKGVVNSAMIVGPLAGYAAKRMINDTKKRRGGGKKENWAHNREVAKEELLQYGKPSALNINKFAALKRKDPEAAEDWLTEYIVKKRKTVKKGKKQSKEEKVVNAVKTELLWKNLLQQAKADLGKYGKPSGANTVKFASLKRKGENTGAFVKNFQTRKQYVEPVKTAKNQYKMNREEAKQYLSQFGKPTVANVSKFVSQKRKGISTTGIENAVKGRVKNAPKGLVSAIKPTKKSPPPDMAKIQRNLMLLHSKMKGK